MAAKLRPIMIMLGMCLDPNAAYLTRRGLKTLPLRIERAQDSAMRLALYLESHPKVAPTTSACPLMDLVIECLRCKR